MHDLVIRGGKVVDGTGRPAFVADVAIDGDRITKVGVVQDKGRREIDATGQLVTPGFVDIHTHYDGQVTWDSVLAPSSIHGVTSIVMGNCGVGFAPARPGDVAHDSLIGLMEGVEDIPGSALHEGLPWTWESFPEYLDAVDSLPHTIDIGAQMPHAALRAYVMGERGADHENDPTPEEIARMTELTIEALEAGAIGFGTSRTVNHRSRDGQKIGSLTSKSEELLGIAEALRHTGKGVLQFVSDFKDLQFELELMKTAAEVSGRPLSVSLVQADQRPQRYREVLDWIDDANKASAVEMRAQVACRTVGLLVGLGGSMHPFIKCPSYAPFIDMAPVEQVKHLVDPELKAKLVEEAKAVRGGLFAYVAKTPERIFPLGDPPNYEPEADESIAAEAERTGREPIELIYDILLELDGRQMLYCPAGNYTDYNLDAAREMLEDSVTLPGLSDGGAHVGFICDASFPTFLLTHWTRDRTRGEKLSVEFVIKRQCADTARHVGWNDRGVLAPGYLADVNVIDYDNLTLRAPTMIFDLPAGGRRLMQKAEGYSFTIKRGQVSFEDGQPTGAMPGRLVRGAQPAPAGV